MTSTEHGGPAARERIGEQVDPYGHGHSPAAWAAVLVVMLGALIASVAVVVGELWLGIVGGVVAVLGGFLGKLLGAMGFGAKGHSVE
jgi:hypothetical protein